MSARRVPERPRSVGERGGRPSGQSPGAADGGGLQQPAAASSRDEPGPAHALPRLAAGPELCADQHAAAHPVQKPEPEPHAAAAHAVVTEQRRV